MIWKPPEPPPVWPPLRDWGDPVGPPLVPPMMPGRVTPVVVPVPPAAPAAAVEDVFALAAKLHAAAQKETADRRAVLVLLLRGLVEALK